LTGAPAGERADDSIGGSVNRLVEDRLRAFARIRKSQRALSEPAEPRHE
jgi:hypothetical protein